MCPSGNKLGKDGVEKMVVKCKDLRFLFIDEFEAMGVQLAAELEESIVKGVPQKNSYRYHSRQGPFGPLVRDSLGQIIPRGFAGVNVFLIGDLY